VGLRLFPSGFLACSATGAVVDSRFNYSKMNLEGSAKTAIEKEVVI
jgi:hypothetical protein